MQLLATGAKAKLQTFALAAVAFRGHGASKKLNSYFMSYFYVAILPFISQVIYETLH
jgi:hypothetical protein